MELDHDSGTISGQITEGPFKGKSLDQLTDQHLLQLYQQCGRYDPRALKLLDAYIERHRPGFAADPHHTEHHADAPTGDQPMTESEAYQILGLKPGASEAEIAQAHKRMMQKNHPDRGGSNYLAAKINQAKQRLLG
jgi:DnaJ-domain-containing protein 1